MRWLMLCREPRLYSCKRIKEVCEKKGIELDILDPNRMLLFLEKGEFKLFYQEGESYNKNRPVPTLLKDYDAVLPRFGTTSTEMGCRVLRHFEAKNTPVLNHSTAFALARDKWQSLQCLAAKGLPVPDTNFAGSLVSITSLLKQIDFPIVAKVLNGSQGNGIMLFEKESLAESVLSTLKSLDEPYLCQTFIQEAKGADIRVFVIGKQVVASMQRVSNCDEFRANIHQGGKAQFITLSETEKKLAVKATQAIGLDVAGVDLIRSKNGLLILEVNASPGFEGLEQVCKCDIADNMVEHLVNKIKKHTSIR